MSFLQTFEKKKVLVTGHTGFKGSWLSLWLWSSGADVFGLSDMELVSPSHYQAIGLKQLLQEEIFCDVRDLDALVAHVNRIKPDFVFHLAAQPLVKQSMIDPLGTYMTNAIGTLNILRSIGDLESVVAVLVTSDKVYENQEWFWGYRESDDLGGKDPYSASKAMAEIGIQSFFRTFYESETGVKVAVGRAGNVIGGGDWAADRLIPDTVRAWSSGSTVSIRNPGSTRPWQHVLEPLGGYLKLAYELDLGNIAADRCEAFNFGPRSDQNISVRELLEMMLERWGEGSYRVDFAQLAPEAGLLRLNCDKAAAQLGWTAALTIEDCVALTIDWYAHFLRNANSMRDFSLEQIKMFEKKLIK